MKDLQPENQPSTNNEVRTMTASPSSRPAWVEIDLAQLHENFRLIQLDCPEGLSFLSVVKDQAYGHGAVAVAHAAVKAGARMLAVYTLEEAIELRETGLPVPVLMLGERHPDELPLCLNHELSLSLGDLDLARRGNRLAAEAGKSLNFHLKIDTGMSRYGVRWDRLEPFLAELIQLPNLRLQGVMTHFAQSDEADKTFALEQLDRYCHGLDQLKAAGLDPGLRHLCNSGGYLDLREAHFDCVRLGILPLGVYPSRVCRRIPGIKPVLSLKAKIVATRTLQPGDSVGYGMRYTATEPRRIAILPLGYGDGFPRLRNEGHVLIEGRQAPLIGSVAMDTIFVDITDIPEAQPDSSAVLIGKQGELEINARDLATWGNTVCYDTLTSLSWRLPRRYLQPASGS